MVKEMRLEWNPSLSLHKHNHVFVKFAVSLLLLGIALRLLLSRPIQFYAVVVDSPPAVPLADTARDSSPFSVPSPAVQTPVSVVDFPANQNQMSPGVVPKCDIFAGDWIQDQSGPRYTNESCHVIEGHQNCMKNGRPDSQYLYWRWKPRGCELPKFSPERFLDMMRDKSWAFVGDSISRNHVQSLLCVLSQVEQAVEVYHDEEYRSKRWHFPSHNFTLSVIWTPFLVKATIFEDMNGVSSSEIQLHLDQLDETWTEQYESFDYVVIGGGKWFLKTAIYHENDTITGCHYCPGKNLTELGFDYAYRRAIRLVLGFLSGAGGSRKKLVILRTTTPDHFENGEWFSGGTCNRTVPFKEGEVGLVDVDRIMRDIELEEFEKATAGAGSRRERVRLRLLDTTRMSLLRPDGHPGPYRKFQPFTDSKNAEVQNDCLHWCLPGAIDSWNDLVMQLLING
ncbi:protein trichome birefringence-like 25 [Malania oleifera]|uniref:protein trichome birefringence-like 25 n=1 Tax=Malania oleifera TaxID=397392 RepID=UPI0025ADD9A0|nr:protein trichome birefringence-like 25 [Malania oleifera]